jgi:ankyrin repeat protein
MPKMKIAIALVLLAGLITLAIMADSDQVEKTTRSTEVMTLENLIFAAKSTTPDEFQAALESKIDINEKDRLGRTALTEALLEGANANAQALIEAGADVTIPGREGYTPLILASNNGDLGLLEAILDKGANPRRSNDAGMTALHTACRSTAEDAVLSQIVGALLRAGADPNAADSQGFTPLMVAASRGRKDALILLLDKGARINERNNTGMNAITYAIMSGDFASRASWEMDLQNPAPGSDRRLGMLALALEQADSLGSVRLLLSKGADINIQDNGGWTPIMRAAGLGNIENYKQVITIAGGDPELPDAAAKLKELVRNAKADQIVLALRNADAYVNVPNDVGADALTISRMRIDPVGKIIHGLLLDGKRVSEAEFKQATEPAPGPNPDN